MTTRRWGPAGFVAEDEEDRVDTSSTLVAPRGDGEAVAPALPSAPVAAPARQGASVSDVQSIALDLAEQWRRIDGREPPPRPIGPPPPPAGPAPLPSAAEQRAAIGGAP